ncbi:hypothetical protein [Burkholderia gladioli]|uniref:hypothetical protein n=1 Tax=Burkholderia gladioli TaxID=28095 RepID=UPI0016402277|nr:hypothetical protein [Burkholderia gladioli]
MSNVQVMNGLLTLVGVAAFIGFFYGPWQWMVADAIRQRWFEIRDAAFDAAVAGKVSFDDPNYARFRNSVNTLIGTAETSSVWRMVATYLSRPELLDMKRAKGETITGMTGDVPLTLKLAEVRIVKWFLLFMWLRSPLLIAITVCLCAVAPFVAIFAAASANIRRIVGRIPDHIFHIAREEAALQASPR